MKTMILCALLIIGVSGSVYAEMTVSQYKAIKDKPQVLAYVQILEQGFGWANAVLLQEKKEPLYCQPSKVSLKSEDLVYIIDREIDVIEKGGKLKTPIESIAIAGILLNGLRKQFPCPK